MSKQKFTVDERLAFWEVYNQKCIYCSNPILELSNLQIDHLLPENLYNDKVKLQNILKQYNLPDDYDIFNYYNLVASCIRCNSRKWSHTERIINPINLNIANKNAPKIKALVHKYRKKLIANRQEHPTTVSFEFMFREKKIKGSISKSKLVDLYDLPVYIGGIDDFALEGFNGSRPENPPIINTVSEYIAALNDGWYADTNFSMKMSGWLDTARCFLYALEIAKLPKISYFSDNEFSFKNINELSELLARPVYIPEFEMEAWEYQFIANKSLNNYFDYLTSKNYSVNIELQNDDELRLEAYFTQFYFRELLRADFSGGGYEEILCLMGQSPVGGSLSCSSVVLLQKHAPQDLITYKYFQCK